MTDFNNIVQYECLMGEQKMRDADQICFLTFFSVKLKFKMMCFMQITKAQVPKPKKCNNFLTFTKTTIPYNLQFNRIVIFYKYAKNTAILFCCRLDVNKCDKNMLFCVVVLQKNFASLFYYRPT